MIAFFRRLFVMPDHIAVAKQDLAKAQRELLKAEDLSEYAGAQVARHEAAIERLRNRIKEAEGE